MDNMTAKVSCFARAYHHKNNSVHIFDDGVAEAILEKDLVLCQDLVQVKMRNFSHFNLPKAQP